MSTLLFLLAAVLACTLIVGWLIWRSLIQRARIPREQQFQGAATRKLAQEERIAVENYLERYSGSQELISPSGASNPSPKLRLTAQSSTVISLTRSITRYGLSADDANKWRYYLDAVEVHLPPFWEQYIANDNDVELIRTSTIPLVISLNGNTLQNDTPEAQQYNEGYSSTQTSIRGEESEQIELLDIRQETREEHSLSRPDGLRKAIPICVAFLMLFLSLIAPPIFMLWLTGSAMLLFATGLWGLFAPPAKTALQEIHSLRGTPKRWGLFGESNQEQPNNISLGIIDLIYPPHWQSFVARDLGQKTDIDIYLDRRVVRQGRFLSLHEEARSFPLQHWMRNLLMASSALLVLVLMTLWIPLEMPIKLSMAWLKGAQSIEATGVQGLTKYKLQIGDTLRVNGTGMCNIHAAGSHNTRQNSPFTPFDCSQIIWNTARPLPLPESEILDKAVALSKAVNGQLNPRGGSKVNPQLANAIQKSGMVLLDDFVGIVKKTQALCTAEGECIRLKNALVNLGNTKDWNTLIKRADSGKLSGVNVLLRPVSAESLDNLVATSTAPFFIRETARAAQSLNSPAPGGYVIVNDEGSDLVDRPLPPVSLYNFPAQEQWAELLRLADMLLQTPFHAEGIVTGLYIDANGTQHVTLHRISDTHSPWSYISTSVLLIATLACLIINAVLTVIRYRRAGSRLEKISRYYENCFNPTLTPPSPPGSP